MLSHHHPAAPTAAPDRGPPGICYPHSSNAASGPAAFARPHSLQPPPHNISGLTQPSAALQPGSLPHSPYLAPHISLSMTERPTAPGDPSEACQNENAPTPCVVLPVPGAGTSNTLHANSSLNPPVTGPPPISNNPLARRPSMVRFYSTPTLPCMSPTRQQFRLANATPRQIKETVVSSRRVDDAGKTVNQYLVCGQIGCGTFGTVWKVTDTNTSEPYAMKEYSKSSLRKHLRSELLSQRRRAVMRGSSRPRTPLAGVSTSSISPAIDNNSPFNLIRREFAIAKKLDHPNIVSLIEVLDDPESDSLYLILEWCANGPVMSHTKTRNNDDHQPPLVPTACLSEEQCRLYFRDMILGIEYLHSQGVIHRDIKADNLLLDEDDVLKIADFGVSELFEQDNDVITKTAGSPSYMAPELAVISNGALMPLAATRDIPINSLSGRSADIWSMGVTLYYMLFGVLPFRADNVMDLYTRIVTEDVEFPREDINPDLKDLFARILCKSPPKRIKMDELRIHPWVTHRNQDALVSKEENISDSITQVTEEDISSAIERVRSLGVEPEHAMAKLRKLHGWRGQPSSRSSSRSPSLSPYLAPHDALARVPSPTQPLDDTNLSLQKLTRALEEVARRSQSKSRTGATGSTGGPGSSSYYNNSNSGGLSSNHSYYQGLNATPGGPSAGSSIYPSRNPSTNVSLLSVAIMDDPTEPDATLKEENTVTIMGRPPTAPSPTSPTSDTPPSPPSLKTAAPSACNLVHESASTHISL